MSKAYVIMCNDCPKFVCLNEREAEKKLEVLRKSQVDEAPEFYTVIWHMHDDVELIPSPDYYLEAKAQATRSWKEGRNDRRVS